MNSPTKERTLLVGFGLAGAVLYHHLLKKEQDVFVVDENEEHTSSKVAGGMWNPMAFRRINRTWNAEVNLPVAIQLYEDIERTLGVQIMQPCELIKIFPSIEYANDFSMKSHDEHLNKWIHERPNEEFDKEHQTPYGYGSVSSAGRLNVKLMLDKFKERLVSNQRWIEEPFVDNEITLVENGVEWRGKFYNRVVFCRGHKELDGRWFKEARIQANKGELLDLVLPKSRITSIINNGKFLIPLGGQNYRLGATYGRNQRDTTPTQEAKELLLDKMKEFLPEDVKMKEHLVGIRPTVTDRKPIIGWRDDDKRICIFNGLGTRGVLNAPYTASCFIRGLFDGEPIPEELDFMRFVW